MFARSRAYRKFYEYWSGVTTNCRHRATEFTPIQGEEMIRNERHELSS